MEKLREDKFMVNAIDTSVASDYEMLKYIIMPKYSVLIFGWM